MAVGFCKTRLEETGCLGNPYFTHWLPKHPVFSFTLTQSDRLPMVTYPSLCSSCVTYRTLCHTIGHQVLHTPAFNVIPHPSVRYCQAFRPILYFQSSSSRSDLQLCPQPLPREAEDLPRGDNHSKHEPLLTYLA